MRQRVISFYESGHSRSMIIILPALGTQLITPFHACCKLPSSFCVLSGYCVWVNLKQTMQSSKLGHSLARVNQFEIGSIHRHRHIMYLHLFISQWLLPFLTCFRELIDWKETTLFGCNVSAIVIITYLFQWLLKRQHQQSLLRHEATVWYAKQHLNATNSLSGSSSRGSSSRNKT